MPLWKQRLLARYMAPAGDDGADGGGGSAGDDGAGGDDGDGDDGAGDDGASDDGKGAADKGDGKAKPKSKAKPTDAEAALLKENMQKKAALKKTETELAAANARLKEFDGLDAAELKKLVADKKAAEEAALAAKGDFETLKQRMATEHANAMKAIVDENAGLKTTLGSLQSQIEELTVGQSFSNSKFISDETVLTPTKARKVYGEHFDVVEGQVVAFDKPRGAQGRTALVDQYGNNMAFEVAMAKLVEMDADKDHVLKAKQRAGAGSSSQSQQAQRKAEQPVSGMDKIQAGLGALFATR